MFECFAGAVSAGAFTAAVAGVFRKPILRVAATNEELLAELTTRGFNVEDFAMESHLKKTFEILCQIGEGNSGSVWQIRKGRTGEIMAVKKIQKQKKNGRHIADEALETELNC